MQDCLLHKQRALPPYADMAFLVIRYARLCSVIIPTPLAFCLSTCCQKIFATAYAVWRETHSNTKITYLSFCWSQPSFLSSCNFPAPPRKTPLGFLIFFYFYWFNFSFFIHFLFLQRCYNWGTGQIQCLIWQIFASLSLWMDPQCCQ